MEEDTFYATFYCASVTRCYPGRSPAGRGDRTPTPEEQELCAFWREHELRLLRPQLVVTVGGLAARRILGIRRLTEAIGERYELADAAAIPLPHPSGASGWLNDRENRARLEVAARLVLDELARLG
jgi:uracil-DNA glycosylase family 4